MANSTAEDEQALVVLAEWAGFAIENARMYRDATERRDELQRAVGGFEAALAVARAVGGETHLDRILELIVKRGRALVDARSMFVALESGGRLTIDAVAGELERSLEHQVVRRVGNASGDRARAPTGGTSGCRAGRHSARSWRGSTREAALLVPLVFRGTVVGLLGALDPESGADRFSADD